MHRRAQGSPEDLSDAPGAGETIAAISTPAGEGAIALVRISGPKAIAISDAIFRGKQKPSEFESHVQHFGEIVTHDRVIDQVMLSVHRAPHSYTGEDLIEISCHGGIVVSAQVLEVCLTSGARAARGGEFTERAYHNGKMDLTQAEAVIDLIRAQTDLALRSATEQLEGKLGAAIRVIRDAVVDLLAHVEAAIDFPEEGISPDRNEKLRTRLDQIRDKIKALLATEQHGRILREGVRVVIYGATNAGKSSLLNRLLGYDRAIVSHIPGTTRDTIEEVINLRGVPVRLLDTAGVRATNDELERAGLERTEKSLGVSDLILHIADLNAPKPAEFDARNFERPRIVILNKSDLPEHKDWQDHDGLRVSCLTENGMEQLEECILDRIGAGHVRPENSAAINARHRDCLRRALDNCDRANTALAQGLEFFAIDLRAALRNVTDVIALESDDPILDALFAQFCIGK